MSIDEINDFIAKLIKNDDFNIMLDSNASEKIRFSVDIVNKLLNNYSQISDNPIVFENINNLSIDCNNPQTIITDFYKSLGIPVTTISEALNSIVIENDLKRAYHSNGKIHMGQYDSKLGYITTAVHEIAHFIRNKYSPKSNGEIAEIESKISEQLFYQYLVDNKINLIIESGVNRPLTQSEINLQRFFEMKNDKNKLYRVIEEFNVVELLKNNMKLNGSYFFTQDQYNQFNDNQKDNIKKIGVSIDI